MVHVVVTNPGIGATSSKSKSLSVAGPVTVAISPKTKTIRGLASATFSSHVANSSNPAVAWSVNGVVGGNATLGAITTAGTYTAPAVPPASVTIAATSIADPTKSDSAILTLQNPVPVITSASPTITAGVNASFTLAGIGFAPTAQVNLENTSLTVKWTSSTLLTATGGPVQSPPGGMLPLQVVNPNPGSAASNVIAVTVKNPGTKLTYAAAKRFLDQATWGSTPASIAHLQPVKLGVARRDHGGRRS
jgi:hypothetical protein